jgi:hypothetical protein
LEIENIPLRKNIKNMNYVGENLIKEARRTQNYTKENLNKWKWMRHQFSPS